MLTENEQGTWRVARVVYWSGLENRRRVKSAVGSTPTLSAIDQKFLKMSERNDTLIFVKRNTEAEPSRTYKEILWKLHSQDDSEAQVVATLFLTNSTTIPYEVFADGKFFKAGLIKKHSQRVMEEKGAVEVVFGWIDEMRGNLTSTLQNLSSLMVTITPKEGDCRFNNNFELQIFKSGGWIPVPDHSNPAHQPAKLRVLHFPQVPCKPFEVLCSTPAEARKIEITLANQHLWLFENNFIPDYSNVIVVECFDEADFDEGGNGWGDFGYEDPKTGEHYDWSKFCETFIQ